MLCSPNTFELGLSLAKIFFQTIMLKKKSKKLNMLLLFLFFRPERREYIFSGFIDTPDNFRWI